MQLMTLTAPMATTIATAISTETILAASNEIATTGYQITLDSMDL
jgi:hypothetical protein